MYRVKSNQCKCHPETCCCDDWAVYDADDNKQSTWFHKVDAETQASTLNEIELLHARLKEKDETLQGLQTKLAEAEKLPDVDWLSNVIRSVDGNNTLGAGVLAEKIVDAIQQAKRGEG